MKNAILLFMLIYSVKAFGQTGQKNFIDQNYIEVKGTSELNISPDKIYLHIVINEKEHKGKTADDVEKLMIEQLTSIGIDTQKQLVIKDFVSNLKSIWIIKNEILAIKQYELLVFDADLVAKTFKSLNDIGIPTISVDRLENSEMEHHKKEAKIMAIKQAQGNAEALASAIGQGIGNALLITEEDNRQSITGTLQGQAAGIRIRGVSSTGWKPLEIPEIEFQKIKIEYQVKVLFELK